jgi:hypothetical protein
MVEELFWRLQLIPKMILAENAVRNTGVLPL